MGLRVRARRTAGFGACRRQFGRNGGTCLGRPCSVAPNNAAFSSSRGAVRSQWSWLRLLRRHLPVLALALLLGTVIAGAGPALSALPTGSAVTTAATYGSTLAVSRPSTTNSGDVLIASVYARLPGSATITPPSGWALIRRDSSTPGYASLTQALYYKVATSSEPAAYVWSVGSQASAAGAILDFKGIDTTSPVDSHGGAFTRQSTSFVAPSVTTTAKNDIVLGFFCDELDQDAPATELDDRGLQRPLGEQALEPRRGGRRATSRPQRPLPETRRPPRGDVPAAASASSWPSVRPHRRRHRSTTAATTRRHLHLHRLHPAAASTSATAASTSAATAASAPTAATPAARDVHDDDQFRPCDCDPERRGRRDDLPQLGQLRQPLAHHRCRSPRT